jgi:predicted methyltransferase
MRPHASLHFLLVALALALPMAADAQVRSVNPGINRYYENPSFEQSLRMFEGEGREVFDRRHRIVAAVGLQPGMAVADIGAGTGLFTRLFAAAVGATGRVYAVDISPVFVHNIARIARDENLRGVEAILGGDRDSRLAPASIDVASATLTTISSTRSRCWHRSTAPCAPAACWWSSTTSAFRACHRAGSWATCGQARKQ